MESSTFRISEYDDQVFPDSFLQNPDVAINIITSYYFTR